MKLSAKNALSFAKLAKLRPKIALSLSRTPSRACREKEGRICLAARATSDVPPRETKGPRRWLFSCPDPYESELSTGPNTKKAPHYRATPFVSTGGGSRIRTGDPMLAKHVLYQLSYTPVNKFGDAGVP